MSGYLVLGRTPLFTFHVYRAAVISFHTVLTVVGGKRIPGSVVTAVVLGGWAVTGLLSTR